jgi:tetratricopeptide (TPR) repeat protein
VAAGLLAAVLTGCSLFQTPPPPPPPTATSMPVAPSDPREIWNDPAFQAAFIGTYGINAQIEPRPSQEELEFLEKILPLMKETSRLPEAKAEIQKNIALDTGGLLYLTVGNICFQLDEVDQSLAYCLEAVKKTPSFRRAWRNLGLIYVRKGNYDDAIRAFTRMVELGGGDKYSYGLLGFAYASKEDYQAAEVAYRNALLLDPENTEWRLGLTRCVYKQEKYEDAVSLLNVLIAKYPDKSDFWLLQAHSYLGLKKPLKAAVNLETIDRLGKATPEVLHSLGDIYLSEGLPEAAAGAYCRAIDLDAAQPAGRAMRGAEALASRGALPQARQVADHIQSAMADSLGMEDKRSLLKLRARMSLADGSSSDETAGVLEEVVKIDPLDGEALMLLGQHYARSQPEKAIFWYERAAGIEKFENQAKFRTAQVLVAQKKYREALPLLRRVQEIKPRDDVARFLEQVERASKAQDQPATTAPAGSTK